MITNLIFTAILLGGDFMDGVVFLIRILEKAAGLKFDWTIQYFNDSIFIDD